MVAKESSKQRFALFGKSRTRKLLSRIPIYIFLIVLSVAFIYPFLFMLSTSLKETQSFFVQPTNLIPENPTLTNFQYLFESLPFSRWVLNTFFVASVVTLVKIIIDSMAGYAFARRKFKGKEILFALILGTMMIPVAVTMIPTFLMIKNFDLIDTYWGLILPPLAYPLGIFLMRQYMLGIPSELEDAAKIDGCTDFNLFLKIFFPLSAPAIAVLAIVTFMNQWVSLLWPTIVTNSMEMRTLVVGISVLKAQSVSNWGLIMAANFASFFPMMIVFVFLQKYFIEGMTVGAVKG